MNGSPNLHLDDIEPLRKGNFTHALRRTLYEGAVAMRNNLMCYSQKTGCFYVSYKTKIYAYEKRDDCIAASESHATYTIPTSASIAVHPFLRPDFNFITLIACRDVEYLVGLTGQGKVILWSTGHLDGQPIIFHVGFSAWSVALAPNKPWLGVGHNGYACTVLDLSLSPRENEREAMRLDTGSNVPCVAWNANGTKLVGALLPSEEGYPGMFLTSVTSGDRHLIPSTCPVDGYGSNWSCFYLQEKDFTRNVHQPDCHLLAYEPEMDEPNFELVFVASEKSFYFTRFDETATNLFGSGSWRETFASVDWTRGVQGYGRLNLVKHIKSLGCIIVGDQFGALRVVELCHRPIGADEPRKQSRLSFRLLAILTDRPGCGRMAKPRVLDPNESRTDDDDEAHWCLQSNVEHDLYESNHQNDVDEQRFCGLDVVLDETGDSAEIVALTMECRFISWTIRRLPTDTGRLVLERSIGKR